MLCLVGLGLYDEKDISVNGLEAIKSADVVYAEFYTARLFGGDLKSLESLTGVMINILSVSYTHLDVYKRQVLGGMDVIVPENSSHIGAVGSALLVSGIGEKKDFGAKKLSGDSNASRMPR